MTNLRRSTRPGRCGGGSESTISNTTPSCTTCCSPSTSFSAPHPESAPRVRYAARVLVYVNLLRLLLLTYKIAVELYGDRLAAALSALLFLLLSVTGLFVVRADLDRPDVFHGSLGLLSRYAVVRFFRLRDRWSLVWGGLAAGLSVLFLQKGVVFTGLVGLVLLGRWLWGHDLRFGDGLLFAGSAVGVVFPCALFLLVRGRWFDLAFFNFTCPVLQVSRLRGG